MRMFKLAATVLCLCSVVSAQAAEYQVNGPDSSLTLDGVVGTTVIPAVTNACVHGLVTAAAASPHVGLGYEVVIAPAPLISATAGAVVTPGGQLVNVDFQTPGTTYLWGGTTFDLTNPFPASQLVIPFNAAGTAGSYGYQLLNVTPSHLDGFVLSQGCQLDVGTALPTAPQGDDTSTTVALGACVGSMPFYGTVYTELHVSSNGRIVFGNASNDFSASIAEALNGDPFFGFWTDLNPVLSGSITLDIPSPGQLRATWNSVPYYAEPGTPVSFSLIADTVTGDVSMTALTGIPANPINNTTIPSNDTQFLGLSMGAGATDGGPTLFLPGASGTPSVATDMIYDWFDGVPGGAGRAPSLASGMLADLRFSPAGSTYVWSGFSGNPAPQLTSMTPTAALTGSAPFTLSVTGASFVNASVVRWNGTPVPTTFVSPTQLDATIDTSLIDSAGTAVVTVFTPTPGGGATGGLTFQIDNPVPVLSSMSPSTALTGGGPFTLTVSGSGFVPDSTVEWDGAPLPTTFVSATQLDAAVDAPRVAAAGTAIVTVSTAAPGGGTSAPLSFQIDHPVPVLTSMSPTTALTGAAPFTLTVTGTDYVLGSVVQWNGAPLPTTFVSATQLDATVSSALVATAGTATVTVFSPTPGGGTTAGLAFQVDHPVPVLTSTSPSGSLTGAAPFTMTVNGSDFVSGSVVQWNGAPLPTTFVSATQLDATVSTALVATAGTATITVFSPTPGGGTSVGMPFQVDHPVPTLTSMSPTTSLTGAAPFTLTAIGTGFVSGSVVQWNGSPLATTFVSPTQLDATVDVAQVAVAGTATVTVFSPAPGGGTTIGLAFQVDHPVPVLTSMSPTTSLTGAAPFTLTVNGSDYVSGSIVHWNGTPLATTFVSATQLDATVDVAQVATAGTASITVVSPAPGGGTSSGLAFQVDHPVPVLTSMSPTTSLTNAAPFTLTVTGSSYVSGSVVHWNGAPLATTFVSSTQLDASVGAVELGTAGTVSVTVVSPAPGGGTTSGLSFQVDHPVPVLTSMSPTAALTNAAPFTLTVTGSDFVSGSVVRWNGSPLATTFVSPTQLDATVGTPQLTTAGSATVTVVTPTPGGGTTVGLPFQVDHPVPVLASMSPTTALTNAGAFTLTVTGSGFASASVVEWNGTPLTTTFVSATQLDAAIAAPQVATAGTVSVTVVSPTPGGGTSAALPFQVDHPVPVATSLSPTTALTTDPAFTMTVTGTGFVSASVVQWDGTPLTTTFVSETQLDASVTPAQLATAGTVTVTVFTPAPGGGSAAGLPFQVDHPTPVLSTVSPNSVVVGSPMTSISVTGSSFESSSEVLFNGTPLATTFVNAGQLSATVPASLLDFAGTFAVTVSTPAPGGGASAPQSFDVRAPTITAASLTSIPVQTAGFAPIPLTVTGADFIPSSVVYANTTPLATTFVSSGQLDTAIDPQVLQAMAIGAITINVSNTTYGVSNPAVIQVGSVGQNGGTLRTVPPQSVPGQTFFGIVEGCAPSGLITIAADTNPGTPVLQAGLDMVIGVGPWAGGAVPLDVVVDGLGFLTQADGTTLDATGSLFLPAQVHPSPSPAYTVAIQGIYIDPTAAVGFRLTWARWPIAY